MSRPMLTPNFLADIDLLRGLFAFMVLMGHAFDVSLLYASKDPAFKILAELRGILGFVWVAGFVVLSGFCIELSCMKRPQGRFLWRYTGQRASRIFPLLIVCVAITGVTEWLMMDSPLRPRVWEGGVDIEHFWINVAGVGGFFGQFGSIAPAYTISYELLYYSLWGLSRAAMGSRVQVALLVNFGFALGYVLLPSFGGLITGQWAKVLSPFIVLIYLPWLLGAATAHHLDRLISIGPIRGASRFAWPILLVGTFLASRQLGMPSFAVSPLSLVYYLLLGGAFIMLIVRAYDRRHRPAVGTWKHQVGEASYPLYLVHGPVIVFIGFLLNHHAHTYPFFLHFSALIIAAIVCAAVLVVMVERPVMRARRLFFK